MKIDSFQPPANIDDADSIASQRQAWSNFIAFVTTREVERLRKTFAAQAAGLVPQYYSPLVGNGVATNPVTQARSWNGFPRVAAKRYGDFQFEEAERLRTDTLGYTLAGSPVAFSYRYQDEYLEWHATRDPGTGRITRVDFTCEGPEWWSALANGSPSPYYSWDSFDTAVFADPNAKGDLQKVVQLYRTLLGTDKVVAEDLVFAEDVYDSPPSGDARVVIFPKGHYNPWNVWNTVRGAVHLTHPANTLGAEINLAAQATIRRKSDNGHEVSDSAHLICCSGYGNPTRNSDPAIGYFVNGFARANMWVTLLDPIGLYITSYDSTGITVDGQPNNTLWKVIRPSAQIADTYTRYLRLSFVVPVTGDVQVNGKRLDFGGQLATNITMMLVGAVDGAHDAMPLLACPKHGCKSTVNPDLVTATDPSTACNALGAYEELDANNVNPVPATVTHALRRRGR